MANYLAIFTLPKPEREHAKIIDVIRDASNGDFKQSPVPGGGLFLFSTEKNIQHISFDKILLNKDSVLIVEIGQNFTHQNHGSAAGWFGTHCKL